MHRRLSQHVHRIAWFFIDAMSDRAVTLVIDQILACDVTFAGSHVTMGYSGRDATFDGMRRLRASTNKYQYFGIQCPSHLLEVKQDLGPTRQSILILPKP